VHCVCSIIDLLMVSKWFLVIRGRFTVLYEHAFVIRLNFSQVFNNCLFGLVLLRFHTGRVQSVSVQFRGKTTVLVLYSSVFWPALKPARTSNNNVLTYDDCHFLLLWRVLSVSCHNVYGAIIIHYLAAIQPDDWNICLYTHVSGRTCRQSWSWLKCISILSRVYYVALHLRNTPLITMKHVHLYFKHEFSNVYMAGMNDVVADLCVCSQTTRRWKTTADCWQMENWRSELTATTEQRQGSGFLPVSWNFYTQQGWKTWVFCWKSYYCLQLRRQCFQHRGYWRCFFSLLPRWLTWTATRSLMKFCVTCTATTGTTRLNVKIQVKDRGHRIGFFYTLPVLRDRTMLLIAAASQSFSSLQLLADAEVIALSIATCLGG